MRVRAIIPWSRHVRYRLEQGIGSTITPETVPAFAAETVPRRRSADAQLANTSCIASRRWPCDGLESPENSLAYLLVSLEVRNQSLADPVNGIERAREGKSSLPVRTAHRPERMGAWHPRKALELNTKAAFPRSDKDVENVRVAPSVVSWRPRQRGVRRTDDGGTTTERRGGGCWPRSRWPCSSSWDREPRSLRRSPCCATRSPRCSRPSASRYRWVMWLQRPPTAMYFRRGGRLLLQNGGIRPSRFRLLPAPCRRLRRQSFHLAARPAARRRPFLHHVGLPQRRRHYLSSRVRLGPLRDGAGRSERAIASMCSACPTDEFAIHSLFGFIVFHGLVWSSSSVIAGVLLAIRRRLRDHGSGGSATVRRGLSAAAAAVRHQRHRLAADGQLHLDAAATPTISWPSYTPSR